MLYLHYSYKNQENMKNERPSKSIRNTTEITGRRYHHQTCERKYNHTREIPINKHSNKYRKAFVYKFKQLMQKGSVNGALRLLTNNSSNGVLPLSDETLQILSLKHPEPQQAHHEAMLQGPKRQIHSIVYGYIDEDLVKQAA